jgi:hypothetical protein
MGGDPGSNSSSTINTSEGEGSQIGGGDAPDGDRQSESESSSDAQEESSSNTQEESSSDTPMQEGGDSSSDTPVQEGGESSSDPQEESSSGTRRKDYTSERLTQLLDKYAADLSEDIKNLSISMEEATDDDQ